jgi:hypothetical protein
MMDGLIDTSFHDTILISGFVQIPIMSEDFSYCNALWIRAHSQCQDYTASNGRRNDELERVWKEAFTT